MFRYDKKLYYSPNFGPEYDNAHPVPPPPEVSDASPTNPFSAGKTWNSVTRPHRWTRAYAWAAFIPLKRIQTYPFNRLWHTPAPVTDPNTWKFSLPESTIETWTRLDCALSAIATRLTAEYKVPAVFPYTPRGWGYHQQHHSKAMVRALARNSADWFMVWAGLLAYIISFIERCRSTEPDTLTPNESRKKPMHWKGTLREMGYPPVWLDALESLARDRCERSGIFFSFLHAGLVTVDEPTLDFFVNCNVPVWYEWDSMASSCRDADKDKYLPPVQTRVHARLEDYTDLARPLIAAGPTAAPSEQPPPIEEVDEDRRPWTEAEKARHAEWDREEKKAREARKAYIDKVFKELRARDDQLKAMETDLQKDDRLLREKRPPTTKATVYIWEPSEDDDSVLVRKTVSKGNRTEKIQEHGEKQRCFFSSLQQWHLCEDLAFGEGPEEEWDDDGPLHPAPKSDCATYEAAAPAPDDSLPADTRPLSPDHLEFDSTQDAPPLYRLDDPAEVDKQTAAGSVAADINERLQTWFGYVPLPGIEPDPEVAEEFAHLEERDLCKFMRNLGWALSKPGVAEFLKSPQAPAIWKFSRMFTDLSHPVDAYGPSFDVEPNGICPFSLSTNGAKKQVWSSSGELPTVKDLHGITHLSDHRAYHMAFDSPVVALAALRIVDEEREKGAEEIDGIDRLVFRLYRHGCRFYTLIQRHRLEAPPPLPMPFLSIPERPKKYRFGPEDYEAYQEMLSTLLSLPRMRAAGMHGGYVWRLSQEHISVVDILKGPDLPTAQVVARNPAEDGLDVCSNLLTDLDIDLIIGTYKVSDGPNSDPIMKSWWPHPKYEEERGEFCGIWTNFLEVGFDKRLKEIKSGKAQPLSVKEWKDRKGPKEVRLWDKRLRDQSKKFLDNLLLERVSKAK
ncbi:hypothetical protein D9611_003550 [Ephemerocybe angulata]|uniref:Uncharacterized protein n=1 Tax=Ephemerocybe angulata TaxID=980116 RepID=A0A8H5B5U9_9AGAR|nr:hypothetical protein D9611_003550 [Tulosesus angulatus]